MNSKIDKCNYGRMFRAIELGLPQDASWEEISRAYAGHPTIMTVSFRSKNNHWKHPLSEKTVYGERIVDDLTVLKDTDVYASTDGTWKKCPISGLLYRSWAATIWIRPTELHR